MLQLIVDVPDELAPELLPHEDHLLALIQLGLVEWRKQVVGVDTSQVEQVFDLLANEGKLIRPKASKNLAHRKPRTLIPITGKPVSELVVALRNRTDG